jgi:hypothetical protein
MDTLEKELARSFLWNVLHAEQMDRITVEVHRDFNESELRWLAAFRARS